MRKNEAGQVVAFQAVSSTDGSAVTTGSPTVYVTIDGGTQATGTNTAIHEGQGAWTYVPTQAETNGDHIVFTFTLSGCINQSVNVYPVVVNDYKADVSGVATQSSVDALNDLSAAEVNAQVDTALADYDGPTKAEMDAAFAALNDLSAAQVNAEVDTALSDYDGPTKAEMDAGFASLNDPTVQQIVDGVCDEALAGHTTAGSLGKAIADIEVDTNELQTNQGNWLTATGFSTFNPATDTVANVTTVATCTTNTDMRGTDNALLAASAPTNWSIMLINGSGEITTSNPASGGGSAHTAEDVRDLILAGDKTPITMATNKVSNVALVDTTTTNTDMRGTDSANTVAPDNASISDILADTNELQTNQGNWLTATGFSTFNATTDSVTVGTNNDKTGYALSSAANDAIGAAFLAYTLTKGAAGTIERAFWQSLKTQTLADGEVSGTPTASAFDTNLTAVSGAYDHLLLLFVSGALTGEARPIDTYSSTNGRITLQEDLTAAPTASDEFIIVPDHSHPVPEISEATRDLILAGDQTAIVMSSGSVSTSGGGGSVTVGGFTTAALLEMIQTDTGVTVAGDGSVAKISQGAAGGNVTVGSFTTAALAEMVTTDTGETSAVSGSVVQLSQVGGAVGSGSRLYTETVTVDSVPVQDVDAWVTTDDEGTVVVAGTLKTDVNGQVTFALDPGTYYIWLQKDGLCFSNPTTVTVS